MSILNKAARLRRMSGAERRLLAEAVLCLGIARALVVLVPFRWISRRLERQSRRARPPATPDRALVTGVRRAVTTAANHVPWNAVCLPQALAARFMLSRRHHASTLHLGVGRNGTALIAHAWLECEGVIVVGEEGIDAVTAVARFA